MVFNSPLELRVQFWDVLFSQILGQSLKQTNKQPKIVKSGSGI